MRISCILQKISSMQEIKDFLLFPVRVLFNHETVRKWGLTSLQDERINICSRYCSGRVLDVGCGKGNNFIKSYGNGVGIDILIWDAIDICCDASQLPFRDCSFDTVTFMGSLRYTKDRIEVLKEAHRVLKMNGLVLILENNFILNFIRRKLAWWNPYSVEYVQGFWKYELISMLNDSGFSFEKTVRYVYGISKMYTGIKK